jgi:O-antigen/teichoic acid export membrane protein
VAAHQGERSEPQVNAASTRLRLAAMTAKVTGVIHRPQAQVLGQTAGLNVATTLLGSLGGLLLARVLGPTHRGDLVTILLWPAVIGSVASLGITQSTCYWVSRRPSKSAAIVSTAIMLSLITGVGVAVCAPWISTLIGRNGEVRTDLTFILIFSPIYIAGGTWMSTLQATSMSKWNLSRAIQPSLYLLGVGSLWALGALTLGSAVIIFAVSLTAQTAYSAVMARRIVGRHRGMDASLIRPLYSYGVRVSLSSVPQLVNVSLDQLLLSVLPGVAAAQLGNYAVAASLSWLALPAATAFGSVAFPRIARTTNEGQARRIEEISLIGACAIASATIILVVALAPLFIPTLFGHGYNDAVVALYLLAPGVVFLALNRVIGDILQGRGRPLARSAGEGLGAVATVILLLELIPRFGIRGAAVASSVAYALVFIFLLWALSYARRHAPIDVSAP